MMEQRNLILAIALSIAILLGFQYFFEHPRIQQAQQATPQGTTAAPGTTAPATTAPTVGAPALPGAPAASGAAATPRHSSPRRASRSIPHGCTARSPSSAGGSTT
jgi:YidC/Oxa1 family membrane protein insertase